jgi:hypothetical protein
MPNEKFKFTSLFKDDFRYRKRDWPKDHPGYVFLARALDEMCAAAHGSEWLRPVREPKEKPTEPADDCKDEAVWDAFDEQQDRYDLARKRDEWEVRKKRQAMAREIVQECEAGNLVAALRPIFGGRLVELEQHFWNTEDCFHRFLSFRMSLEDPFSVNADGAWWIYLTRDSLDEYLASLDKAPARDVNLKNDRKLLPKGKKEQKPSNFSSRSNKQRAVEEAIQSLWPDGIPVLDASTRNRAIRTWIDKNRHGMTVSDQTIRRVVPVLSLPEQS